MSRRNPGRFTNSAADPAVAVDVVVADCPSLLDGVSFGVLHLARDRFFLVIHAGLCGGFSRVNGGDHFLTPSLLRTVEPEYG
jgi:hypothetical protein